MPGNVNSDEPPRKAVAIIPPFQTIIDEGTQEIKRQVDAQVDLTLGSTSAVHPETLRKWGDEGGRYFFRRLKARVSEQVGAAVVTRTATSIPSVSIPAGPISKATPVGAGLPASITNSTKVAATKRAKVPIAAVKHWKAKQRYRSSYVTAAIITGLLNVLILTIGAIILIRLMA